MYVIFVSMIMFSFGKQLIKVYIWKQIHTSLRLILYPFQMHCIVYMIDLLYLDVYINTLLLLD